MSSIKLRCQVDYSGFVLDVELSIPAQGITGILGPSGSGKTTLLRALAGLDRHAGSVVSVAGEVWQSEDDFLPVHERRLGYVFQESGLFAHLNVRDNIEYGHRRAAQSSPMEPLVSLLNLGDLLDRDVATLSGGERQRVAIARALAANPRVLLMDEPLSGLDVARRSEIMPYLESLHQELEIPIVYVSHALEEIARLSDQVVVLENGAVVANGPVAEVFTRLDLPPAHWDAAAAVIEAQVVANEDDQLVQLKFSGGSLLVPALNYVSEDVRLQVAARDVSLTLEHQSGTSILNILKVTVTDIAEDEPGQVLVQLDAGGTALLSRVTGRSARELDLKRGQSLFAQVKGAAVLR